MNNESDFMEKTITIICGCHGVGKTSFLGGLTGIRAYPGELLDEDTILSECGKDTTLRDKIMIEGIRESCQHYHDLVLKMSLSSNIGLLKQELAYALGKHYIINLCYIVIDSLDDCLARVKNRVQKGGRSVSAEDVKDCFNCRWEALVELIPYCSGEISFYDNNNGFQKIGSYREESLTMYSQKIPKWMQEFIQYIDAAPMIITIEER